MNKRFEQFKDHGVTEHGRVSHEELANKMLKTKVWAYPTEFDEVFCITAVKADLAGCKSVLTDVAALKETAGKSATLIESDIIYSDEYSRKKFVDGVVAALKSNEKVNNKDSKRFGWKQIAKQWGDIIDA